MNFYHINRNIRWLLFPFAYVYALIGCILGSFVSAAVIAKEGWIDGD